MSRKDFDARRNFNRKIANDKSSNRASNYRQPWCATEDEILDLWDGSDAGLTDVAELLGRTREACRQRFYVKRNQ